MVRLPDDLRADLERFVREERSDLSLEEAAVFAIRDWCGLMGYRESPRDGRENGWRAKPQRDDPPSSGL